MGTEFKVEVSAGSSKVRFECGLEKRAIINAGYEERNPCEDLGVGWPAHACDCHMRVGGQEAGGEVSWNNMGSGYEVSLGLLHGHKESSTPCRPGTDMTGMFLKVKSGVATREDCSV